MGVILTINLLNRLKFDRKILNDDIRKGRVAKAAIWKSKSILLSKY